MDLELVKEVLNRVEEFFNKHREDYSDPTIEEVIEDVYEYYDFYRFIDSIGFQKAETWLKEFRKRAGL